MNLWWNIGTNLFQIQRNGDKLIAATILKGWALPPAVSAVDGVADWMTVFGIFIIADLQQAVGFSLHETVMKKQDSKQVPRSELGKQFYSHVTVDLTGWRQLKDLGPLIQYEIGCDWK